MEEAQISVLDTGYNTCCIIFEQTLSGGMVSVMKNFKLVTLLIVIIFTKNILAHTQQKTYKADIVVYGGTSAGVMAAVQSARLGKSVILVAPSGRLGGLSASGLGQTDVGKQNVLGGLNAEFYGRIYKHYDDTTNWFCETRDQWYAKETWGHKIIDKMMFKFEPHVAEKIFNDFIFEHDNILLLQEERLNRDFKISKNKKIIESIIMESGLVLVGKIYIDCTYEGDLMAAAGVHFTVGREANSLYDEKCNGIQTGSKHHQIPLGISAYQIEGDPDSGLLPGVLPEAPGKKGEGDHRLQAYCFRLCLTDNPENQIPFPKPEGYNRQDYELLRRIMEKGVFSNLGNSQPMPNRKTDTNNSGGFSSDYIGMNYTWAEGSYKEREKIYHAHKKYQMGMWYYLTRDPQTPKAFRAKHNKWGLAKDEFKQTGGWPHALYVREGRRMIGQMVMTEHHCTLEKKIDDPIAQGGFNMDSHNVSRYADENGFVRNEGDVQNESGAYKISYRAITPKPSECSNLLVPVCLSASHIAYGSIRMEPVFMSLGQSAATAASLAIDEKVSVQKVNYNKLKKKLLLNSQKL